MTLFQRWASSSVSSTALSRPPTGITGPFLPRRHSIRRCPTGSLPGQLDRPQRRDHPGYLPHLGASQPAVCLRLSHRRRPGELLSGAGGAPLLPSTAMDSPSSPRPRDRNRRSGWRPDSPVCSPRRQYAPPKTSGATICFSSTVPGVFLLAHLKPGSLLVRQGNRSARDSLSPPAETRATVQSPISISSSRTPPISTLLPGCPSPFPPLRTAPAPQLPPPGPPPPWGETTPPPYLTRGSRCPPPPP